jgi:hypothetical protein
MNAHIGCLSFNAAAATAAESGLPDGIHTFEPKILIWSLEMEKVGIFFVHSEYIMAIWYILWPFGNLVAI